MYIYQQIVFIVSYLVLETVSNIESNIRLFEYSILSNSKLSNLTDIRKCRIPKSNYSKISNT